MELEKSKHIIRNKKNSFTKTQHQSKKFNIRRQIMKYKDDIQKILGQ